jgi:hypothetical protein
VEFADIEVCDPSSCAKIPPMLAAEEMRKEGDKLLHDTMKQLVTISSGSILVIVALLEKVFPNPRWKVLVAIGFVGFLICIIASLVMMRAIALDVSAAYSRDFQPMERKSYETALASFLFAIAALVLFVIRNLLWS